MSKKYCYLFTEGNAKMRELLGGKGANLAEMTNTLACPCPRGFLQNAPPGLRYCRGWPPDQRRHHGRDRRIHREDGERSPVSSAIKGIHCWSPSRSGGPPCRHDETPSNLGLNEDVVDVIAKKSTTPAGPGTATAALSGLQTSWRWARNISATHRRDEGEERASGTWAHRRDLLKKAGRSVQGQYKSRSARTSPLTEEATHRHTSRPCSRLDRHLTGSACEENACSPRFGNMGDDCGTGVALPTTRHRREEAHGQF